MDLNVYVFVMLCSFPIDFVLDFVERRLRKVCRSNILTGVDTPSIDQWNTTVSFTNAIVLIYSISKTPHHR